MPDRISRFTPAWLIGALVLAGCARDPVSSLDEGRIEGGGHVLSASLAEAARSPLAEAASGRIPDFTVGTVWTYDVTIRRRTRPQDESEPWTEWTTLRVVREARALEERMLDGRTYVLIQEFDVAVDPPAPTRAGAKIPHRRDDSGLYHRPPSIVIGTIAAGADEPEFARRGGPVGADALLIPNPARPGVTFESNHQLRERWIVEQHDPIRAGIGTVAAVRTRMIAGESYRHGDVIVAWYAPTGRVASHENVVRVASDQQRRRIWSELDTQEILRSISLP